MRPGPERLPWGRCPGGIICHAYAVPDGELISVAYLTPDTDLERVADVQAAASASRGGAVCLVFFDGDTGERMIPDGMRSGERL